MQVNGSSNLPSSTQSSIDNAVDKLQSGVPFEFSVDTPNGKETLKGDFQYAFLEPAGQNLYFTPGQSAAPQLAKNAFSDALQKFLLSVQEDASAGTGAQDHPTVETFSTSTSFSGQNSSYEWGGTFTLVPDMVTKTARANGPAKAGTQHSLSPIAS
jgi:hypothetical protein